MRGGIRAIDDEICDFDVLHENEYTPAALDGQSWAIQQVADRIDGKPAQESTVNIKEKREASDWTREELMAILAKHVKRDDEAKPTAPSTDSLN